MAEEMVKEKGLAVSGLRTRWSALLPAWRPQMLKALPV